MSKRPQWLKDIAAAHAYNEPGRKPLQLPKLKYYRALLVFADDLLRRAEIERVSKKQST